MIHIAEPILGKEELANLEECIRTGWVSYRGPFVKRFEEDFAKYIDCKFGIATSSCTSALHLALLALGIGPGDEVIVPTLTFIATANAVTYTGAKPILVDSHPNYWCMDPKEVEKKITKRTKAIIPVHLYGHPCDMDAILKIASKFGLYIVEDCAEAIGAKYRGELAGSLSHISCFSFFANTIHPRRAQSYPQA